MPTTDSNQFVADDARSAVCHVAVVHEAIDIAHLQAHVEAPGVGAISLFLGAVREHNDGRVVTGIDYEAYQPMAERELRAVAEDVSHLFAGVRLAVEHRVGSLSVGDISVAIACGHARRAPAMAGAEALIELLKQRVPIWKREHYVDGAWHWIDPTLTRASHAD